MYDLQPVASPTPAGLLALMDRAGVDISVVLPVATRPEQVRSINDWAAEINSDRIVCFGALHPDFPEAVAEVERMISLGLGGVKFQPQFQEFYPDEERLWPMYEALEGRLLAVFHSGQEIVNVPHVYARPASFVPVRARFPRLRMVLAHLGGFHMRAEARAHIVGQDYYLDMSYSTDLSDEELTETIRAHGAEKVLFGTDFPWSHPRADLDRLRRLPLTPPEFEAITWRTAAGLLGRPSLPE